MTIPEFIAKWRKVELKERSAAQEHFIDLCNLFEHPTPATSDPTGETFCFEKGAAKHGGGDGFADVWKRGFFGWEYKGKHKDLTAAYDQLLRYRNALENPPLLVLCDLDRIIAKSHGDPVRFGKLLAQLFETMATGGDFGLETIRHFNGSLFDDPPSQGSGATSKSALDMTGDEIKRVAAAAELDWSAVDPSIFGTLFECGLDPAKRSQLGAHFTGMADIELLVDAVIVTDLRREWNDSRATIEILLATGKKPGKGRKNGTGKSGTGVPPVNPPVGHGQDAHATISAMAKELNELRETWLNPSDVTKDAKSSATPRWFHSTATLCARRGCWEASCQFAPRMNRAAV